MPTVDTNDLRKALAMARSRFLYGLERVPEDRLNWSPGGSAATPLQLADKVAGFAAFITHMARTGERPDRSGPPPAGSQSVEEARAKIDAALGELQATLAGLTEADLDRGVPAPWGSVPVRQMVWHLPGILGYFQGQLNYAQLAYGDTDANIPPGWGTEEP